MATWQGVNINSGTTELPKYNANGDTDEIYVAAVTTALASGDIILGPVVEAGNFITDVVAAPDKLDSAVTPLITFEVGFTNAGGTTVAGFIAAGATAAQNGGVVHTNVPAGYGYAVTQQTTLMATITAGAGTVVAGNFRLGCTITPSP